MSEDALASDSQEPAFELAGVGLRLAHSCHRLLIWECALLEKDGVPRLEAALLAQGFEDQSRFQWIRELVSAAGHTVVIVPRTGRVQIRIHYLTPLAARSSAARDVAARIAEGVAAARARAD